MPPLPLAQFADSVSWNSTNQLRARDLRQFSISESSDCFVCHCLQLTNSVINAKTHCSPTIDPLVGSKQCLPATGKGLLIPRAAAHQSIAQQPTLAQLPSPAAQSADSCRSPSALWLSCRPLSSR